MSTQLEKQAYPVMKGGSFLIEDHAPADVFTPEDFSEEHRMIAQTAEDFVFQEVVPMEPELEKKNWVVLVDLLRKAAALGLTSMDVPEEYGGLALDKVSSIIVSEKISASASFATTHGGHAGIGTLPIVYFGNAEQKAKYLPRLATAELPAAYCLTEPGSGSDALAARTKAVLNAEGTHYVLNGEKMWITNGGLADIVSVFARTERGVTAFVVETTWPGFHAGPPEKKMGIRGSTTNAITLENVRVPKENMIGDDGRGFIIAMKTLDAGRLGLGAACTGAAKDLLERSTKYAKERVQFDVPISQFEAIQFMLAEMAILIYAMECMVYRTAADYDAGKSVPRQAATVKYFCSESLDKVADMAVQIHGGMGYSRELPIERVYRDSRINRIFEGTNEIQKVVIAKEVLKKNGKM